MDEQPIHGGWNPKQYEKFKDQRSQPFFDLMHMLAPRAGGRAVDLGCGTGELTQTLHRYLQAKTTEGLDSSREMLGKAQKFTEDGLSFVHADIELWRPPPQQIDVIFSNAALQWCQNHEALFVTLAHALSENGQLAVQMPMNHDFATHVLAQEMSREPRWNARLGGKAYDKFDAMLSIEEYARLLFRLGFREQRVTLNVYAHILESREGVIEWVKGSMLTYFRTHLEAQDYQEFEAEFRERLFRQLPDERPYFYPFKRMLLWAKR